MQYACTDFGCDFGMDYQPGFDIANGGAICRASQSRPADIADGYTVAHPMAQWTAGSTVTVRWPAKNHADVFPDSKVFIYATPSGATTDAFDTTQAMVAMDYNVCDPPGSGVDRAKCTGSFQVPAWAPGIYSFVWFWEFNPGQYYNTCFDTVRSTLRSPAPSYLSFCTEHHVCACMRSSCSRAEALRVRATGNCRRQRRCDNSHADWLPNGRNDDGADRSGQPSDEDSNDGKSRGSELPRRSSRRVDFAAEGNALLGLQRRSVRRNGASAVERSEVFVRDAVRADGSDRARRQQLRRAALDDGSDERSALRPRRRRRRLLRRNEPGQRWLRQVHPHPKPGGGERGLDRRDHEEKSVPSRIKRVRGGKGALRHRCARLRQPAVLDGERLRRSVARCDVHVEDALVYVWRLVYPRRRHDARVRLHRPPIHNERRQALEAWLRAVHRMGLDKRRSRHPLVPVGDVRAPSTSPCFPLPFISSNLVPRARWVRSLRTNNSCGVHPTFSSFCNRCPAAFVALIGGAFGAGGIAAAVAPPPTLPPSPTPAPVTGGKIAARDGNDTRFVRPRAPLSCVPLLS